jgi:ribosome maturation factor RimP
MGRAVWPRYFPDVMLKPRWGFSFFGAGLIYGSQRRYGGPLGPFFVGGRVDTAVHDRLIARFEPELQGLGYELVDVEFAPGPGGGTLRFYIDLPGHTDRGIDAEDCGKASHALLDSIEADDPLPGDYSIEVSSPGLDRVLRTPEHFARFVDNRVKVELAAARDGRKRFTGMLRRTDGESIEMEVDNFSVSIRLAEISKARLAPL